MKKTLMTLAGASLLALSFASAAQAQATINRDQGCNLFNGLGNLVFADTDHTVITPSGKNNLTCRAKGLTPTPDGRALVTRGFPCNTSGGSTTKTHSIVTPSGNSTLICQVK